MRAREHVWVGAGCGEFVMVRVVNCDVKCGCDGACCAVWLW